MVHLLFYLLIVTSLNPVHPTRVINVPDSINKTKSLEYYLCHTEGQQQLIPGVTLVLNTSIVHQIGLGKFCVLRNLTDITITTTNSYSLAAIQCSVDTPQDFSIETSRGFAFIGGINITLERLHITQCGGPISPSFFYNDTLLPVYFGANQSVALFFSHTVNLTLVEVTVSSYYGFAIAVVNVFGTTFLSQLQIFDSLSADLHICTKATHFRGNYTCYGSGLLIYNHDNCTSEKEIFNCSQSTNDIVITESSFYDNRNLIFDFICILNVFQFQPPRIPIVSGAALTIFATQSSFNTTIKLTNSNITQNSGLISGGLLAVFVNTPYHSFLQLDNIIITNNTMPNFCVGRAFASYIYFTDDYTTRAINEVTTKELLSTWTPIVLSHTVISHHSEYEDKSSTVYVTMRSQSLYNVRVILQDVDFINNSATYTGICLNVNTAYEPMIGLKRLSLVMRNINALGNTQANGIVSVLTNSSLFVFYRLEQVLIEGVDPLGTTFSHNLGSVIDAFSTDVYLKGNIVFSNNKASKGPAILLRSSSFLVLSNNTSVLFENNTAFLNGGAVYSVEEGTEISDCIFQIDDRTRNLTDLNINLTFIGNLAYVAGNSMYIRPLHHCFQSRVHIFPGQLSSLYGHIFNFPDSNAKSQMSSIPVSICKCSESKKPLCGQQFDLHEVYPGDSIYVTLVAQDENSANVQSQVNASFSQYMDETLTLPGWSLDSKQEIRTLIGNVSLCQTLQYTILSDLAVKEGRLNFAVPGQPTYTHVPIMLKECPPGFTLDNTGRCQCNSFANKLNLECDFSTMSVTKQRDAWVGIITENNITRIGYSQYCPHTYCSTTDNILFLNDSNSTVCLNNREGILCGNCKDGYSAVHGGQECKICDNRGLLWLIGNASVGIILVILLFVFKLTLNVGTIGGLIFYANVFDILNTVPTDQVYAIPFVQLVQFLNVQQGFPSCLYDGMPYYLNIFFHFAYSLYLWFIAILIVFVAWCSSRVAKLLMESSVQVLMTLIHLSFAKILVASIDVFVFAKIQTVNYTSLVWLYNGSINYGTGVHIPLLATASLCTVCVIIPYIALALSGWMCLRFSCINKFRPFFDTIYGPYKDSYRYWFGLRLVLLVVLAILTATLRGPATFYQYLIQVILLTLFAFFQAYVKPFRKRSVNILDNWCMINVLALVFINIYRTYGGQESSIILLVTLVIVCVTILTVFGHHVLMFFKSLKVNFCQRRKTDVGNLMWIPPQDVVNQDNYESIEDSTSSRSHWNDFRESLLEYIDTDVAVNN